MRLHRSSERARAAELYQEVLRTNPHNFQALFLLGMLHGEEGRFEEAQFFTGEAAKMRDDLGLLVKELEDACDKFEVSKQRYLEREARKAEKLTAKRVLASARA